MTHQIYFGTRLLADRLGFDPWDVSMKRIRSFIATNESRPTSRFWFGSPCRFIRSIDIAVHVWLPDALVERHPVWACYLRTTSPRWGRAWRSW